MKYSYLLVFIIAVFVSACTRPVGHKPSSMTIALPKEMKLKAGNSAQAVLGFLGHVVVNIRGPGIDVPISVNFDADKHDGSQPTSLPGSFTFDVPAGSGRLIQIMAVYLDTTTMVGDFYYGDVTQELISGDNNVMIPVNLAGSGSVEGGRITGRYFLADGSTPSGIVESRYQPPNGNPALVIEKHSMLNGWFSSFVLDTIPMDVVLAPSEVKMFAATKMSSFDGTTLTDNKKMKVILPDRYQSYGGGSGDMRKSETAVVGFFGDGVPTGAKVCFTEAARSFTQLFTDSTKTVPLQWSSSSTKLTDVRAVKGSAVVACTATDLAAAFTTVIPFNPALLNNWGGSDAISGFVGMFRFPADVTMGSSPVRVSYNNVGQYNTQFSVLPGSPSIADSVGVFYRASNSPRDFYGSGGDVPCQQFSQGGLGFLKISSIPLVAGTLDYNINNPAPADISNSAVMAFCPMKNGVAVGGGVVTDYLSNNPGGVPQAANSFSAYTEFNTVGTGQCHRIRLSLTNESGGLIKYNVTNSTARSFVLTSDAVGISFHADESTCIAGTSIVSSISISSNSVNGEIWYKNTSAEISKSVTITSNSFATAVSRIVGVSFQTPGTPSFLKIREGSIKMASNECRMLEVYTVSSTDVPGSVSSAATISLNKMDLALAAVTDTSFDFYSDCISTTPVTSLGLAVGDFKKSFAIKTGGSPSNDRVIQLTGLGTFNLYYNVLPLADHLAISINNGNPVYKGSCVPLYIEAQDALNSVVNTATFNFNLNVYHPTIPGAYGNFKNSCSTFASSGTLATGSYSSLTFSATAAQAGIQMEAQSIFQGRFNPTIFDIRPAPPVERPTLKVHLMSDDLIPVATTSPVTSWPVLDTSFLNTFILTTFTSVDKGNIPRRDGALFTSASSLLSGPISGLVTDALMMTVKFKLNTLPAPTTSADILSLDTGAGSFRIYVDDTTGGVFKIKGSGGWIGTDIVANTWYTVSLSNDGAGNTNGYVNGVTVSVAGSSGNPAGTSYTNFRIGSGFQGAVKAVIIDMGTGSAGFDIFGDVQYINNRVSDN